MLKTEDWISFSDQVALRKAALEAGLNEDKVCMEALRVQRFLEKGHEVWPLEKSFQDVIPWSWAEKQIRTPHRKDYVAFVPAAGAASRYGTSHEPKALKEAYGGKSFLRIKDLEHGQLKSLWGQVFIAPKNWENSFHRSLEASSLPTKIWPQNTCEYTPRFGKLGALQIKGKLSLAPGGHGRLHSLLLEAGKLSEALTGIFLRNIDNSPESKFFQESIEHTETFLNFHRCILKNLNHLRKMLLGKKLEANAFWDKWIPWKGTSLLQFLQEIQKNVFHTSISKTLEEMEIYFQKPFILFGVVPMEPQDRGGALYWTKMPQGESLPFCVEAPHIPKNFPQPSFFNPVFLAMEAQKNHNLPSNHPFWIVAEKIWNHQTVFYHEELLCEILSSPKEGLVIFLEIPRVLFNPHKFPTLKKV